MIRYGKLLIKYKSDDQVLKLYRSLKLSCDVVQNFAYIINQDGTSSHMVEISNRYLTWRFNKPIDSDFFLEFSYGTIVNESIWKERV